LIIYIGWYKVQLWPEISITKLKYEVSVGPTVVVGPTVTSTSVDYY